MKINTLTITYSPPAPGKPSRAHYALAVDSAAAYTGRNQTLMLQAIRRAGLQLPAGTSLDRACVIHLEPRAPRGKAGRPRLAEDRRFRVSVVLTNAELAVVESAPGRCRGDQIRHIIALYQAAQSPTKFFRDLGNLAERAFNNVATALPQGTHIHTPDPKGIIC